MVPGAAVTNSNWKGSGRFKIWSVPKSELCENRGVCVPEAFAVMVAAGIVRGLFWIRRGSDCKAGRCVLRMFNAVGNSGELVKIIFI